MCVCVCVCVCVYAQMSEKYLSDILKALLPKANVTHAYTHTHTHARM